MKQLTPIQIAMAAEQLSEEIKCWKVLDSRGQFIVFRVPEPGSNVSSPAEGETMTFWRFDTRPAAERFRNRKMVAGLTTLTEVAAS